MFGSKFSARKKIDKNKNQTDDLQKRKKKKDRIEATKSLRTNAFPREKFLEKVLWMDLKDFLHLL